MSSQRYHQINFIHSSKQTIQDQSQELRFNELDKSFVNQPRNENNSYYEPKPTNYLKIKQSKRRDLTTAAPPPESNFVTPHGMRDTFEVPPVSRLETPVPAQVRSIEPSGDRLGTTDGKQKIEKSKKSQNSGNSQKLIFFGGNCTWNNVLTNFLTTGKPKIPRSFTPVNFTYAESPVQPITISPLKMNPTPERSNPSTFSIHRKKRSRVNSFGGGSASRGGSSSGFGRRNGPGFYPSSATVDSAPRHPVIQLLPTHESGALPKPGFSQNPSGGSANYLQYSNTQKKTNRTEYTPQSRLQRFSTPRKREQGVSESSSLARSHWRTPENGGSSGHGRGLLGSSARPRRPQPVSENYDLVENRLRSSFAKNDRKPTIVPSATPGSRSRYNKRLDKHPEFRQERSGGWDSDFQHTPERRGFGGDRLNSLRRSRNEPFPPRSGTPSGAKNINESYRDFQASSNLNSSKNSRQNSARRRSRRGSVNNSRGPANPIYNSQGTSSSKGYKIVRERSQVVDDHLNQTAVKSPHGYERENQMTHSRTFTTPRRNIFENSSAASNTRRRPSFQRTPVETTVTNSRLPSTGRRVGARKRSVKKRPPQVPVFNLKGNDVGSERRLPPRVGVQVQQAAQNPLAYNYNGNGGRSLSTNMRGSRVGRGSHLPQMSATPVNRSLSSFKSPGGGSTRGFLAPPSGGTMNGSVPGTGLGTHIQHPIPAQVTPRNNMKDLRSSNRIPIIFPNQAPNPTINPNNNNNRTTMTHSSVQPNNQILPMNPRISFSQNPVQPQHQPSLTSAGAPSPIMMPTVTNLVPVTSTTTTTIIPATNTALAPGVPHFGSLAPAVSAPIVNNVYGISQPRMNARQIVNPMASLVKKSKKGIAPSGRPYPPRSHVTKIKKSLKRQRSITPQKGNVPRKEPEPYTPPKTYKQPEVLQVTPPRAASNLNSTTITTSQINERISLKVEESPDVPIIDKGAFFNNYSSGANAVDTGDPEISKLALDDFGTALYATGMNGTTVLDVNETDMNFRERSNIRSTTAECLRDGEFVLQEPNSNNLILMDSQMQPKKSLAGSYENKRPTEDLHHYRHSLDYLYLLWRQGGTSLGIVDAITFDNVDSVNEFWTFQGAPTEPVCACSNVSAYKLFGASQLNGTSIVHYHEQAGNTKKQGSNPTEQVFPRMSQVTCCEVSFTESIVYLAGLSKSRVPVVMACSFDESLRELADINLTELDYSTPARMKRVTGTEILLVAAGRHICVVEYLDQNGVFVLLGNIANIHDSSISDFELRGNTLYTTAMNDPLVKATSLDTISTSGMALSFVANSRYSGFQTKKYEYAGLDDLHKVVVSVDGARLFCGGRGLHRFDTTSGGLNPIEIDRNKGNLCLFNFLADLSRFELLWAEGYEFWLAGASGAYNEQSGGGYRDFGSSESNGWKTTLHLP